MGWGFGIRDPESRKKLTRIQFQWPKKHRIRNTDSTKTLKKQMGVGMAGI
jgi:hypothetical protein